MKILNRHLILLLLLLLLASAATSIPAYASSTTIDFNGLANEQGPAAISTLNSTYAAQGVSFDFILQTSSFPRIGYNAVVGREGLQVLTHPSGADTLLNFAFAVESVSVDFIYSGHPYSFLFARDQTGTAVSIESSGATLVDEAFSGTTLPNTLSVSGPCIRSLQIETWGYDYIIDNVVISPMAGPDSDGDGLVDQCDPVPPTADAGGPYMVAVGDTIALDGTGSDPEGLAVTYQWAAQGGSLDDAAAEDPQFTAGSAAGIYEVALTVTDPTGLSDSDTAMVVVFDPEGGFVMGGGQIWSAAGACRLDDACAAVEGRAIFGFVSRYQKGATRPGGNTGFRFHAGNLAFHSSAYEWLVVNQDGTNAQFKGSGTINGAGEYKFMIWAGDGEPDQFRIKIWAESGDEEVVVYDNGVDQPLEAGRIVIRN